MNWLQLWELLQCRKAKCLGLPHLVREIKEGFPEVNSKWKSERWSIRNNLEQNFSLLALLTFGASWFYSVESCSVRYKMHNDIPVPYPLDINSMPTQCDKQKCTQTFSNILWGERLIYREMQGVRHSQDRHTLCHSKAVNVMTSQARLLRLDHGTPVGWQLALGDINKVGADRLQNLKHV